MMKFKKSLKKYFIPCKGNRFKPYFLHEGSLLFFFLVAVVVIVIVTTVEPRYSIQKLFVFDRTSFLSSVSAAILTDLTNEERVQNKAPLLVQNDLLNKAAQMKAEDMATHQYFAHTSPEGKNPWYWFKQVGYNFSSAGENLAVNFFESSDVAQAWMNSPTHRANIVKKDYKEMGIGVAKGIYKGQNTVFVVELFGTPLKIISTTSVPVKTK